ncbi:SCO6745 family protein [Parasphingorhabdus pacifica]
MTTTLARQAHQCLEPLHAFIYFAPEAEERYQELGLEPRRMTYFAGRAAPMGAVGAGVVTSTFYNFNPKVISPLFPRAWSITSPSDVVTARFEAVDAALRRLLGDEVVASESVAEAARLAREATEGCFPEGRPLYAGHAELEWPQAPHLVLWHATSILREFRGDGHIAALQDTDLTGLEALVLQVSSGEGLAEKFAKLSRGWSDEQWDAARDSLRARGLLDEANAVSDEGRRFRAELEDNTDRLAVAPWAAFGADKATSLFEHGAALSKQVAKAGAFPRENFGANR